MTPEVRDELRRRHYNARVIHVRRIHDDLMTLRVAPDVKRPSMHAGQYALLGLGCWEDRIDGLRSGTPDSPAVAALIRRAYSISCPILDDKGTLTRIDELV